MTASYDRHTTLTDNGRLRCLSTEVEDVRLLAMSGELDFAVRNEFRAVLQTAIASTKASLVIDLTGVHYIDSSGFAELMYAWKQLGDRQARLYVVTSPHVQRLLRILGLDQVIEHYETRGGAIESAARNASL